MKLFLISLIPYLIFTIFKTKKSLHMLQQNYYDLDNRYFKWIITNITKIAYESDMLLKTLFDFLLQVIKYIRIKKFS